MSSRAWTFDTSVPNVARMCDYWLGGEDNFAAGREAAERSAAAVPQLPGLEITRQNREFLGRAVRFCAAAGSPVVIESDVMAPGTRITRGKP